MIDIDDQVQADVTHELKWEPSVDAANIGVSAEDGAVTLTGHVASYFAKTRAVRAAERVYAVRAVADEITVELPSSYRHDDASIAHAIAANYEWNVAVPHDVEARVVDGWVTLEGTVDSNFEREAAERAVLYHAGVKGVTNLIEVKERVKSDDVEMRIDSAFRRSATLDARGVHVTMNGGRAGLYGTVHSIAEMRAARHAAYAAPGVPSVESHLIITP